MTAGHEKSRKRPSRRHVLAGAGALALLSGAIGPARAQSSGDFAAALKKALDGGTPREGKIAIAAPEIAENGASVPVTLTVDHPMAPGNHVARIVLLADGNPASEVAAFRLTPLGGKAELSLRIRLARTQNLVAVAELSDRSLWTARREIKVTIGGCGG
jgi:sulfur-oxidizing protein SoxY